MQVKLKQRLEVWKGATPVARPLRAAGTTASLQVMEQRDHLLRQIEALGRILTRLRELIVGSATTTAKADLQNEMRNAGLELSMANSLDPATLVMLLGGPKLDARRALAVGALMHMDGFRAQADGEDAWAARSYRAAVTLLNAARPHLDGERAEFADSLLAELRAVPTGRAANAAERT